MDTLTDDDDAMKPDAVFLRGQRRFAWFCWIWLGIMFGLMFFLPPTLLPRPIKVTALLIAMAALILGVFGFLYWLAPRSPMMKQLRPTARRLVVRIASPIALYIALVAAITWYDRALQPTGVAAGLMALASSVPFLVTIRALMLFLKEESDEFLRTRILESWSLAAAGALAICTLYGFLDQFAVVPHLPLWAVFPAWIACLFPAQQLVNRDA